MFLKQFSPCRFRLLFVCFFSLLTLQAVKAGAAPLPLVNRLAVSFALDSHSLNGSSSFVLPPDRELSLKTKGLILDKILLNGRVLERTPVAEILTFPPEPVVRTVEIFYHRIVEGRSGQQAMIDAQGIVLLDLWHPRPTDPAVYELEALIPPDFAAVSEADEISYHDRPQGRLVKFSFPHPLPGLTFIAGPYVVRETTFGNGKILATYFFREDKELAPDYAAKTIQYLERYEKLLGAYPYQRFSVVENRLPTGFALPTLTLLGQAVVRLPFIKDTSLGHEVLHSWFGTGVGVASASGNWCEGLTTYLADQAFAVDRDEGDIFRKNQLIYYQSYVGAGNDPAIQDFHGALDQLTTGRRMRAIGYNKCAMFFHMLRHKTGDKLFFAALRDFYQRMKHKEASWADIEASFARFFPREDLGEFFRQWLAGNDIIQLELDDININRDEGRPILSFELIQKSAKAYAFRLPLVIRTGAGAYQKSIRISREKTRVKILLEEMPRELIIDNNYDLMRALAPEELPPVWSRFLGATAKLAVVAAGEGRKFAPLRDWLEKTGCRIIDESEVNDLELNRAALLFLGANSTACRALYGRPELPEKGFTLDTRANPLNTELVGVLVEAASEEQVAPVVHLLSHYGKYGLLHFVDGRIEEKIIPASDQGMIFRLDQPPKGVALPQARDFAEIFAEMADNRVIYVGEAHTAPEDHELQFRIIRALREHDRPFAIGMEMFNLESQQALDAFISGELAEKDFLKESHYFKNWGYDYRLYRDILLFARRQKIPVIGLNIDKEIVSNTFKNKGIAGLAPEVKATLPPDRDLNKPGYRKRLQGVYNGHSGNHFTRENFDNFVQAQSLWDETMAETVATYLKANPEKKMVVLAGMGHVVKDNGIPPRVAERLPVTQVVAMNAKEQALDENNADFIFFPARVKAENSPLLGVQIVEEEDNGPTIKGFAHMGSAAQKAGAEQGDVIIAIDGQPVEDIEDVKIALVFKEKGETVRLRVRRTRLLLPDSELELAVVL